MTRLVVAALVAATALGQAGTAYGASRPVVPSVYPVPQSVQVRAGSVAVPPVVRLVTTYGSDGPATAAVRAALQSAGLTVTRSKTAGLWIYVGRNAYAEAQLRVATAAGLPSEGYVLAVGRGRDGQARIVLDGANRAGQFYAAQTFRQLLDHRLSLQDVVIRDWPSFHRRGIVEGFYGTPWTQSERYSMLDWMAAHKLDLYSYGPKDDPYLRATWDVPFPPAYRSMIRGLVRRAAADHVTFDLILSPGLTACYTSDSDRQKMLAKLESAYALGVRSFTLALDDIPIDRTPCASDAALGTGDAGVAAAQASLANWLETSLRTAHPALPPLHLVPTVYNGIDPTAYTDALASALAPEITVEWTGRYGTSVAVPRSDADAAVAMYRHPLYLWDNYFVTDYATQYLALGALDRHDPTLPADLQGILADPMQQAEASKIGLFTLADYAWDPANYDLSKSWVASLREFVGGVGSTTSALAAFADLNWGSLLNPLQAPGLGGAIQAFWQGWTAGNASAAATLDARFATLQSAPATLRAQLANPEFLSEAGPWLDASSAWATAARSALALLLDTSARKTSRLAADRARLESLVTAASHLALQAPYALVSGNVLQTFVQTCETEAGG